MARHDVETFFFLFHVASAFIIVREINKINHKKKTIIRKEMILRTMKQEYGLARVFCSTFFLFFFGSSSMHLIYKYNIHRHVSYMVLAFHGMADPERSISSFRLLIGRLTAFLDFFSLLISPLWHTSMLFDALTSVSAAHFVRLV